MQSVPAHVRYAAMKVCSTCFRVYGYGLYGYGLYGEDTYWQNCGCDEKFDMPPDAKAQGKWPRFDFNKLVVSYQTKNISGIW